MNEALHAAGGRRSEHRQRSFDISAIEAGLPGALMTPATWMTASVSVDEALQGCAIVETPGIDSTPHEMAVRGG